MTLNFLSRHRSRPTPAVLAAAAPVAPRPTPPAADPAFLPGRYRVEYHRVGRNGSAHSGLPAPAPLTVVALDRDELAAAILHDVRPLLRPMGVQVVVDMTAMSGLVRADALSVGTFALRFVTGGGSR